jgi:hypothetical protein
MRLRRRHGLAALYGVLVVLGACSTFSNSSSTPGGADGGADAGAGDVGGEAEDAGNAPFIRSFSKAGSQQSTTNSTLTLLRPPKAEPGDLLVAIIVESGEYTFNNENVDGGTFETKGMCPDLLLYRLRFATFSDDVSASFEFITDTTARAAGILLAVANGGSPDDFAFDDGEPDGGTGAAGSVRVQSSADLVIVAFASVVVAQGDPPPSGPPKYTDIGFADGKLEVYDGVFGRGPTPPFGPFASGSPCWGSLALAIPPKQ